MCQDLARVLPSAVIRLLWFSFRSMTSKTTNFLDSPPLSNHIDSQPSDLQTSAISSGNCTMNGPTCPTEAANHRLHLAALSSVQERGTSNNKDYHSNPSMECTVPALTNIPISRHLRSRDTVGGLKVGNKQQNSSESSSSSFHVSFHGLGKDSFRLTNSDRTGFVDLATAAAAATAVSRGDSSGASLFNHNGTPNSLPKSKPDANNLVLRSGTAANLRHRPYSVNQKTTAKSS